MPVPLSVLAFVPGIADTPFGAEVSTDLCLRDTGESYACKELPCNLVVGYSIRESQHQERTTETT